MRGSCFSYAEIRPNAKAHCRLITKRHVKDAREMSLQEWNDMLPILKDTVAKIERVYKPAGYWISISVGPLGGQNKEHFYMRIVPKYKLGYGSVGQTGSYMLATPEQQEKLKSSSFQPDSEGVFAKKSKSDCQNA